MMAYRSRSLCKWALWAWGRRRSTKGASYSSLSKLSWLYSASILSESIHFRSLEDVSRVITFAKLNEDDLLPVTQVHSALHTKHDWTSNAKACSRSSLLLLPSVVVIWSCWRCLPISQTLSQRERHLPSGFNRKIACRPQIHSANCQGQQWWWSSALHSELHLLHQGGWNLQLPSPRPLSGDAHCPGKKWW